MALEIAFATYRLLFRHPFGTSHGLRDGTDSVFIRLKDGSHVGYGEVTLPPYLKEKPAEVIERLRSIASCDQSDAEHLLVQLDTLSDFRNSGSGCRAGLHMAAVDLLGNQRQSTVKELLGIHDRKSPTTLVTLGTTMAAEIAQKLNELPKSTALKVKVSGLQDQVTITTIKELDDRRIFLDGNQGIVDLDEALGLADSAGDRLLAFEEPFALAQRHLNSELAKRTGRVVYADESVQHTEDIGHAKAYYGGVNIKLMKCGGLDQAINGVKLARKMGSHVMLGSMSESSLGCTAMAQLARQADLVDLDGPWLLRNDPFRGIGMDHGELILPNGPGFGVTPCVELSFTSIGA